MNEAQKQRALAVLGMWHSSNDDSLREYQSAELMAALLQEMIATHEPKPVARVTGYYAGYLSIATVDGRVLPAGTALYTAPPAPSVPECVVDLKHIAYNALTAAAMRSKWIPPEYLSNDWLEDCINFLENGHPVPADLVQDAERYRWLRNPTTDPALVIDKRVGPSFWDYEYRAGDALDAAIDAAIEREKLKGQS